MWGLKGQQTSINVLDQLRKAGTEPPLASLNLRVPFPDILILTPSVIRLSSGSAPWRAGALTEGIMEPRFPGALSKRCAIYTRKSVESRFSQEVTSLDAQRAICAAYISSQQHKRWEESPKHYDDLGRSGANLQRPALQNLLADIEHGLVDVVVVYKLDRIRRTLLDFVRLIDVFDRFGVAFVAITQNFDTSDTMGRLIRNILLTFAQFEREITNDRIRDKKMVMKQRGLWTGGIAPTGYSLQRGKLILNPEEVPLVKCVFETYAETGSLSSVHRVALEKGLHRAPRKYRKGGIDKGGPASYTAIDHILSNPIYVGDVSHKGNRYPGVHAPIIDRALWERVQKVREEHRLPARKHAPHMLTGIIFDLYGRRMHGHYPTNGLGPRYYASCGSACTKPDALPGLRARADQLERLVLSVLKNLLLNRAQLSVLLMRLTINGAQLGRLCMAGPGVTRYLDQLSNLRLSSALRFLVHLVEVHPDRVKVTLRLESIANVLAWDGTGSLELNAPDPLDPSPLHTIDVSVSVDRRWNKHYLPITSRTAAKSHSSHKLLALLKRAREAQELMLQHRELDIVELAKLMKSKTATYSRLIRLNYLAPDIVTSIVDGTQPPTVTRRALMTVDLPTDWPLQRSLLGFEANG